MKTVKSILIILAALGAAVLPAGEQDGSSAYEPVLQYDPQRDALEDIDAAVAEAKRSGRHVLLEVGGDWCIWCHWLDDFLSEHKKLATLLARNFVVVKVNYSPENKNEKALSRYPEVAGYPHFYVLDQVGELLHSQDTAKLEEGKSYNAERFKAFLTRWGPDGE
jgi:thiol:disulfide interchange protein